MFDDVQRGSNRQPFFGWWPSREKVTAFHVKVSIRRIRTTDQSGTSPAVLWCVALSHVVPYYSISNRVDGEKRKLYESTQHGVRRPNKKYDAAERFGLLFYGLLHRIFEMGNVFLSTRVKKIALMMYCILR